MKAFLIVEFHFDKIIRANMSFVLANGMFAFLFLKLSFSIQFLSVFYVLDNKCLKCLRKVIKYTENIHKVP